MDLKSSWIRAQVHGSGLKFMDPGSVTWIRAQLHGSGLSYMGQEPGYGYMEPGRVHGARTGTWCQEHAPRVPVLHHPGYTPPSRMVYTGVIGYSTGGKRVLWALNRVPIELGWTHLSFWSRLSGPWLSFKYHVARTKCVRRPWTT